MAKLNILKEDPVSLAEAKTILAKIKVRDGELGFRATKTEDYLNQFVKLSEKQDEELYKKIDSLQIPRLKDAHIKKIISLLPKTMDDLKLILQGYTLTLKEESLKKIIETLEEAGVLK